MTTMFRNVSSASPALGGAQRRAAASPLATNRVSAAAPSLPCRERGADGAAAIGAASAKTRLHHEPAASRMVCRASATMTKEAPPGVPRGETAGAVMVLEEVRLWRGWLVAASQERSAWSMGPARGPRPQPAFPPCPSGPTHAPLTGHRGGGRPGPPPGRGLEAGGLSSRCSPLSLLPSLAASLSRCLPLSPLPSLIASLSRCFPPSLLPSLAAPLAPSVAPPHPRLDRWSLAAHATPCMLNPRLSGVWRGERRHCTAHAAATLGPTWAASPPAPPQ
jgi:hypothetical protein